VRVFLLWEDFQPSPHEVDCAMLERLVAVADLAGERSLALIATLFTGHMSGVNWIPRWALGGRDGDERFRVIARERSSRRDALEGLRCVGCLGAMLWCHSGYDAALRDSPPSDRATHERTFGLWRADGSPKPAVTAFAGAERCAVDGDDAWIDGDPGDQPNLPGLYERYLSSRPVQP
jgi:endo-1,4-beta-mannosidase